ncbi:MAG: hypothetical protein H0X41_11630 [Chitinophagaceae bacterium]|nr:hypothetical protein [Chitinophagaceae bacterium]
MKYIFLILLMFQGLFMFSQNHVKFRAGIDAAIGFGQDINRNAQTTGNGITTITLGAVKHGISLGVGTGLFKMKGTKSHDYYIPVYGELAYLVPHDKVAPFFSVKIGKLSPQKDADNPYPALNKSTMMYNPSIGLAIDLKAIYLTPFLEYFVPADFNSQYDTFGIGLRIMTH